MPRLIRIAKDFCDAPYSTRRKCAARCIFNHSERVCNVREDKWNCCYRRYRFPNISITDHTIFQEKYWNLSLEHRDYKQIDASKITTMKELLEAISEATATPAHPSKRPFIFR
jgi:hypothetical protein